MKRKISIERLKRLKKMKDQRKRIWADDIWYNNIEEEIAQHPYAIKADISLYAFIYVDYHFGREFYKPKKILFLYNRTTKDIEYSSYNRSFINNEVVVCSEKMGNSHIDEDVFIEDMIDYYPRNLCVSIDVSYFIIFIKSGNRKRFVWLQFQNMEKYKPYAWLFNLFGELASEIPTEFPTGDGWVKIKCKDKNGILDF